VTADAKPIPEGRSASSRLWLRLYRKRLPSLFQSLHQFGMASPSDAVFLRCAVELRIDVMAALALGFVDLCQQRVCLSICILADTRYLPGNL
jgi:hypothetical protein